MASIAKRSDGQWRARYRDAAGREHARHFARKVDAQRWLDETTTAVVTGQYVDPRAGRTTVAEYAAQWASGQAWRPKTAMRVESVLKNHLRPALGDRPVASVRRSDVQAFVKTLSLTMEASTVRTVFSVVRSLFKAAVEDRVIPASPCTGVALPRAQRHELVIPTAAQLRTLAEALPARYAAVVWVAAGLGLRPGEVFGLEVGDIDFLRRSVRVVRQLDEQRQRVSVKTASSVRTLPLPSTVADRLAAHLAEQGRTEGLIFLAHDGQPVKRNSFTKVWRAAVSRSKAPEGLRLHDLRHCYASALIDAGESVRVVQDRMGHASATITLDVYGHLWPESDDRTRAAVDAFLATPADSVRTSAASAQVRGPLPDYLEKA